MPANAEQPVERFLAALPGWMFLFSALALLGMTLITPPWLDARDLAWQRQLMQAQLERLERQQQRYQQFHEALAADDPVLLERLAFTHLRLKPTDKQLLDPAAAPLQVVQTGLAGGVEQRISHGVSSAAIEAWLAEPMPRVGVDVPAQRPIETRLTRMTRGQSRIGMILAAFACFLAALWYGLGTAPHEAQPAAR